MMKVVAGDMRKAIRSAAIAVVALAGMTLPAAAQSNYYNGKQLLSPSSSPTFTGLTLSGLTSGSVLFAGAGGVLSQDNANFSWDPSNHRLGVGIVNPISGYKIEVSSKFPFYAYTPDYVGSSTGSAIGIDFGAASGNTYGEIFVSNSGFSARGQLLLNRLGGNVGLNNINPQALLSIGTTAATARSYNSFTDASNGEWAYMGDWGFTTNVATYGTDKNGTGVVRNLQFVVGGVDKLDYGITTASIWTSATPLVASSIGIGLSGAPGVKLDIKTALVTGTPALGLRMSDGATTTYGVNLSTAGVLVQSNLALGLSSNNSTTPNINIDLSGNVQFSGLIATAGYTVSGLPTAGTAGRRAYVSDQLTTCPVIGAVLTGGGAVKCPVFDNGATWVGG